MTEAYFKDGAPEAGTGFPFLREADTALAAYLTTANAQSRLGNLVTYLGAVGQAGITVRAHRYEDEFILSESPTSFPLVYIASWIANIRDFGAASFTPTVNTRLTVWTHQPNIQDSIPQCVAVCGALASLLKQTLFDGSATEWSTFYSNAYPERTVNNVTMEGAPILVRNREGSLTSIARGRVLTTWWHKEDL